MASSDRLLELTPSQPEAVARAVEKLLGDPSEAADPWWQAGLEEALEDPDVV